MKCVCFIIVVLMTLECIMYTVADGGGAQGARAPPFKKLHTRSRYSNRAVNYSNKACSHSVHEAV